MRRELIAVWLLAAGGTALAQQIWTTVQTIPPLGMNAASAPSTPTTAPAGTQPTTSRSDTDPNGPSVLKLTVYPATPPDPALKYRLLPVYGELTDENGALLYYQATASAMRAVHSGVHSVELVSDWLAMDAEKMPLNQARALLADADVAAAVRAAGYAARCSYCEWGYTVRRPGEGLNAMYPDLSPMRCLWYLIALQTQVAFIDGDANRTVDSLATSFALARDLGNAPTLVSAYLGGSFGAFAGEMMCQYVQSPTAPNLYWALSNLPTPLVDMRRAWEGESCALECAYPLVAERRRRDLTPAEWDALLTDLASPNMAWDLRDPRAFAAAAAVLSYPNARDYLTSHGHSAAQVDAMPPAQAIVTYWCEDYDHWRAEQAKWLELPYWQAGPGLARLERELEGARSTNTVSSLARILLPSAFRAVFLRTRLQRDIALLRTIEALRAYVAAHDKLPATLEEVSEWPIPLDPVYGKPFAYHVAPVLTDDGSLPTPIGAIVLESPAPVGGRPRDGVRYEITFVRPTTPQGR